MTDCPARCNSHRNKMNTHSATEYAIFEEVFYKIGITRPEELAITSNRAVRNETEVDFIKLAGKEGVSTEIDYRTVTGLCEHIRGSLFSSGLTGNQHV